MNITKFSVWLIVILVVSSTRLFSADKQDLRLYLYKEAKHFFLISQNTKAIDDGKKVQVEQNMKLKIEHHVLEQIANGNYKIELSFRSFSLVLKTQDKISRYNSDTVDVSNPFYKTLNFLTDVKIYYEISAEGVISNLSGFDLIKKKAIVDGTLGSLIRNFGTDVFIYDFYRYLSPQGKAIGEKWKVQSILPELKDLKYEIHYTLKEVTPKNLVLKQTASFKMDDDIPKSQNGKGGKISESGIEEGTLILDKNTNLRLSSNLTQSVDIVLTMDSADPKKPERKPMKIVTITNYELVKK